MPKKAATGSENVRNRILGLAVWDGRDLTFHSGVQGQRIEARGVWSGDMASNQKTDAAD